MQNSEARRDMVKTVAIASAWILLCVAAVIFGGCAKDGAAANGKPVMTGSICLNGYCITPQEPVVVVPPAETPVVSAVPVYAPPRQLEK